MSTDFRPTRSRVTKPATSEIDPRDFGRDRGLVPRPEIACSWRRSPSLGLAPDRFTVPAREPALESEFMRAARPVLRRISEDLGDLDVSVILTDA